MNENPATAPWKAIFETYRGAWEQALGGNDPAAGAEALADALAKMRQAAEAAEAAALDGMRTWASPAAQSINVSEMNARIDGIGARLDRIATALEAIAAERAQRSAQDATPSKPKKNRKKGK